MGIRFLRHLLSSNVQPWIKNQNEVIYQENRTGSPIEFNSEAFDRYATKDEVLTLVSPILTTSQQSTDNTTTTPVPPVRGL